MSDIDVSIATAAQRPAFENLMQLYTHDFSEQWYDRADRRGRRAGPLSRRTRSIPTGASRTTCRCCCAWIRRSSGSRCSIAITTRTGRSTATWRSFSSCESIDAAAPERRPRRRSSAAIPACGKPQSRAGMSRGLSFWRRAIGEHPLGAGIEEIDVATPAWNGPVLRFRIRAGKNRTLSSWARTGWARSAGGSDAPPRNPRPRTARARSPA